MTHEARLALPETLPPSPLLIPDVLTVETSAAIQHDAVVAINAEMLQGDAYRRVAGSESMGGNAGTAKIDGHTYSCIGLNGYAERQTGQIITFGNFQDVDTEIVQRNGHFIFRVAVWSVTAPKSRTVFLELHHEGQIGPEGLSRIVNGAVLVNQKLKTSE